MNKNLVDIFNVHTYKNGRLEYKRIKTSGKRKDGAFISIKVENEALPIVNKYLDLKQGRVFNFYEYYVNADGFTTAVNKGLKQVLAYLRDQEKDNEVKLIDDDIDATAYWARHSWATIARNICNINMSDIAEALNHATEHKVTDIYIEREWETIDRHNRLVLDVLLENPKELKESYEVPDYESLV